MTLVSVIVVAYGKEPLLVRCVESLRASVGVRVEVIVVDNGCLDDSVEVLQRRGLARVIAAGRNSGFTGGCAAGQREAAGEVVAFINPDVVVEPDALRELCRVLEDPGVGIATASIRLLSDPELLNAAGNDVHFLGLSWCRGFGHDARAYEQEGDVLAASGAAMAMRRGVLSVFGGFAPEFFAYYEDIELSLRVWQSGLRVVYVPSSVVNHDYSFSANAAKYWLLDRNRILTMLTVFQWQTIAMLLPLLIAQELGFFVTAVAQGWFRDRVRSMLSLVAQQRSIRERRRLVQSVRRQSDRSFMGMFVDIVDPGNFKVPRWTVPLQWPLRGYWRLVKALSR